MGFSNASAFHEQLGIAANDRLAIIHADDIGMSHSSILAYRELLQGEVLSSAATMVPCPWFAEVAALARRNPQIDLGVHLTLTSEWPGLRWGPISTRDIKSGLLDEQGYFPRTVAQVQQQALAKAVRCELQAQIKEALRAGIDVTHFDTHMNSVGHPKFIPSYIELLKLFHVPGLILRLDIPGWIAQGLEPQAAEVAAKLVRDLNRRGFPLVDHFVGLPLSIAAPPQEVLDSRMTLAKQALAALKPGITHFCIHPCADTPELRGITPDWAARVGDLQVFSSAEIRSFIQEQGIRIIGYRALRDVLRSNQGH